MHGRRRRVRRTRTGGQRAVSPYSWTGDAEPTPSGGGQVDPAPIRSGTSHRPWVYLGLHHLELYTDDNRAIQDPIPDTTPGQNNLMSGGTILTEGQIDVLRRSPVLEPSSSSHRSESGAASTQDLAYSHDDGNQAYELCRFECDDETAGCCVFAHLGSVHPHHG